jgi:hypothetical protein
VPILIRHSWNFMPHFRLSSGEYFLSFGKTKLPSCTIKLGNEAAEGVGVEMSAA